MKTRTCKTFLAIAATLLLSVSLRAQTVAWFTVATQGQTLAVPAGAIVVIQYGSGTMWTPMTLKGPTSINAIAAYFPGSTNSAANVIQVRETTSAIAVTVHTFTLVGGKIVDSATPVTVPAAGTTSPGKPTAITIPFDGTCSTSISPEGFLIINLSTNNAAAQK